MYTETVGVVLAGGASARMGSDKAMLDIDGMTLLDRALGVLGDVFDEVVIAGGDYPSHAVVSVRDIVAGGGPLAGLESSLHHAADRSVFLLGVDMPFVGVDLVRKICAVEMDDDGATVATADGRLQPLCSRYGPGVRKLVSKRLVSDDRSMAAFIRRIDEVSFVDVDPDLVANVNTPADLASAIARFGDRPSTR